VGVLFRDEDVARRFGILFHWRAVRDPPLSISLSSPASVSLTMIVLQGAVAFPPRARARIESLNPGLWQSRGNDEVFHWRWNLSGSTRGAERGTWCALPTLIGIFHCVSG